ncbi:MAG: hypothetical protein CMM78_01455 [Rhodospirillaceae bacterium]|jgi:O-antigen ligase|nr:hypothetical protein [Rhodospirillales bacterium]MAX46850.1 hypothetical protein [Rhodospirillaceae bacterium]|tara:strand:- start:799 stop:2112 length:1314 start_codon:yes stop_codon:yes gene_type:complete
MDSRFYKGQLGFMHLLITPGLRIPLTLLVAACCLGGLVQPKIMSVYVFAGAAIAAIGVLSVARDSSWRTACWKKWRIGLSAGLFFLVVAGASLFWFVPQQPLPFDRVGKLAAMGLSLFLLMAVPLGHITIRAVAMGLLIGTALVAVVLIENGLIGFLGTIFVGPPNTAGYENFYKAPATILAVLIFPAFLVYQSTASEGVGTRLVTGLYGVAVLGVLLSGHATSIAASLIGLGIAIAGRWAPKLVGGIIVIGVFVMMTVVPVANSPSNVNALLSATQNHASLQHRVLILDFALKKIRQHPFLGWGLDSARFLPHGSDRIVDTPDRLQGLDTTLLHEGVVRLGQNLPLHPHNILMQIRLELGLPGVAATLLAFVLIIGRIVRLPGALDRSVCFGGLVAAIVIASISYGAWQTWWLGSMVLMTFFFRIGLLFLPERTPE